MLQRKSSMFVLIMVISLLPTGCASTTNVLTFDELPMQPANGLTVEGVVFAYEDGLFANYGGFSGPIDAQFLERPSLDGHTAGTLTLDFTKPTTILKFGIALRSGESLSPGVTVELFDANLETLAVVPIDTEPLIVFTEAKFTHSGSPVRRAVLTFDQTASQSFHLDDLEYVP